MPEKNDSGLGVAVLEQVAQNISTNSGGKKKNMHLQNLMGENLSRRWACNLLRKRGDEVSLTLPASIQSLPF
jgi:hypothetical protein